MYQESVYIRIRNSQHQLCLNISTS